jgi:hypothetical protein
MFGFFNSVFDSVCDVVGGTFDVVSDIGGGVLDVASNVAGGAIDLGSEIGSGAFNLAGGLGNAALDVLGFSVDGIISLAGEAGSGISTVVVDVTGGVADMVGDFLQLLAQDGTDAEAEAARQALERKIARRSETLQNNFQQHDIKVRQMNGRVSGQAQHGSQTLHHKALDMLHQERRSLNYAIRTGKERKAALKQRLAACAAGKAQDAIRRELQCLNRAMDALYTMLDKTHESLNALGFDHQRRHH